MQTTITFNPWSKKTWLYEYFWKAHENGDKDILFMTTNYTHNDFISETSLRSFERMKELNPRRYEVAGLGNWWVESGQIYENWEEKEFDAEKLKQMRDSNGAPVYRAMFGMDFGFSIDPTAFVALLVDNVKREIYIYDEIYEYHMDQSTTAKKLKDKGYANERILCDNNPSTIWELKKLGISRLTAAKKGPGSIEAGIRRIQDYKLIVHPRCTNCLTELELYIWQTKDGEVIAKPIDTENHAMDALRYATEGLGQAVYSFM